MFRILDLKFNLHVAVREQHKHLSDHLSLEITFNISAVLKCQIKVTNVNTYVVESVKYTALRGTHPMVTDMVYWPETDK